MFIDVTRRGTARPLRLAVAAIAYFDHAVDGTVVALIGGETLRVSEEPHQIEAALAAAFPVVTAADPLRYACPVCDPDEPAAGPVGAEARDLGTVDALEAAGKPPSDRAAEARRTVSRAHRSKRP